MGKRAKVMLAIVAVLAVALVGVIGWQVAQPPDEPEPVYKGKPLLFWLKACATTPGREARDNTCDAVRHAGTNAIPTLLRMLRANDPALKIKLMGLVHRQHTLTIQYIPDGQWHVVAARGFWALGPNAQSAVPALIEIASHNTPGNSQERAIYSLGNIGPPATPAVPSLLRLATNNDKRIRISARVALDQIDPKAAAGATAVRSP